MVVAQSDGDWAENRRVPGSSSVQTQHGMFCGISVPEHLEGIAEVPLSKEENLQLFI